MSNFASQGGSVQKRIITFKMVELKTKTIINPNSCFSAILVSWFYVAGCMVLPELPYGSTLLTANLSLTSRPKLRMYTTGLSFKITTKTHKQTHTHTLCVWTHMSCCHQVQYKKGCQPRRANHYPNIKCVNLTNIQSLCLVKILSIALAFHTKES